MPDALTRTICYTRSMTTFAILLGGTIAVTSEVGKGTTFVLEFARTEARPMLVAG